MIHGSMSENQTATVSNANTQNNIQNGHKDVHVSSDEQLQNSGAKRNSVINGISFSK
jgi:hypothetical protein